MSTLVIAEHDNGSLKAATLNAVTAAQALGADIDILVAGENCGGAGEAAAAVAGVGKVLVADNAAYGHQLAENVSLLIAARVPGRGNAGCGRSPPRLWLASPPRIAPCARVPSSP